MHRANQLSTVFLSSLTCIHHVRSTQFVTVISRKLIAEGDHKFFRATNKLCDCVWLVRREKNTLPGYCSVLQWPAALVDYSDILV